MKNMKNISIRHYGYTISIPAEILVVSTYGSIAANTHLVLDKEKLPQSRHVKTLEERFLIIQENGIYIGGKSIHVTICQMEYKKCSLEQFNKLKAFL